MKLQEFRDQIITLMDKFALGTEDESDPGEILELAYADWLHPMSAYQGIRPQISSGFSRDGSGPNTERYNHLGVDLMYPEPNRVRANLPSSDGKWFCPKSQPAINVAPGKCIMVHASDRFSLTMEHRVPGVGQVLVHHRHLDDIFVDEGEIYDRGFNLGTVGTVETDLRHDHFEVHEGQLGAGLKGKAWWKATAINPEPIVRGLVAAGLG